MSENKESGCVIWIMVFIVAYIIYFICCKA